MPTRPRVPTGNPGKRPLPRKRAQPIGSPQKPDFLTGPAADEWDRVVGSMPCGLYTSADTPTLAVFAVS